MFNVTILKIKDIKKYLLVMIFIILVTVLISKYLPKIKEQKNIIPNILTNNSMLKCLDKTMPTISSVENVEQKNSHKVEEDNIWHGILKTQISSINNIQAVEEEKKEEKIEKVEKVEENNNKTENIEIAQTGVATEVITNNPIKESYNTEYGKVKIKNETEYQLTNEMLTPDITIKNKNIVLFHTHSCESYTSSEAYSYTPTGTFRTTDLNYSVTRVGTELENQLKQYNYNVVHNTSYHDYPAYNGSYTRSLATVENILKTTPSDIVIDVHRDAIGSRSDYAPTVKIGEKDIAAQIMFVIGTNNGGLWHPNWNQNLKFAIKIQEKAEEMYPGLFKPIMLTKSRYNQHTAKYASIIEVGATGNTLEQCVTSMKYLAKVMDEIMRQS